MRAGFTSAMHAESDRRQKHAHRSRYFYKLRWLAATYKRGQLRPAGLDTAETLFPQVASTGSQPSLGAFCKSTRKRHDG